jgi:uncharacterized protein YndB with AHSA1/START domain
MNDADLKTDTQQIVVDEVFPHAPETIWRTLTTGELIGRWRPANRLRASEGNRFTFRPRQRAQDGTSTARCWR